VYLLCHSVTIISTNRPIHLLCVTCLIKLIDYWLWLLIIYWLILLKLFTTVLHSCRCIHKTLPATSVPVTYYLNRWHCLLLTLHYIANATHCVTFSLFFKCRLLHRVYLVLYLLMSTFMLCYMFFFFFHRVLTQVLNSVFDGVWPWMSYNKDLLTYV